jgi:hypothetical protein
MGMRETAPRSILVVSGLTDEQRNDLAFYLKEDTVNLEEAGLPVTALGDFRRTVLAYAASAALITGVLAWVGNQPTDTSVKIDVYHLVSIDVTKTTTPADVQAKLDACSISVIDSR